MNRPIKYLLLTILVSVVFTACEKEYFMPVVVSDTDTISFKNEIAPIFTTNCAISGCHNSGGIPPVLEESVAHSNLISGGYIAMVGAEVDTANAASSKLYEKIDTGSMAGFISKPEDKTRILQWIKQGALNN